MTKKPSLEHWLCRLKKMEHHAETGFVEVSWPSRRRKHGEPCKPSQGHQFLQSPTGITIFFFKPKKSVLGDLAFVLCVSILFAS